MIRIFRHYVPKSLLIFGSVELLILFGSMYLGVYVPVFGANPTDLLLVGHVWTKGLTYALVMTLLMATMGLYERSLRDDHRGLLLRINIAFFCGLLILLPLIYFFPELSVGSAAFTTAYISSLVGVSAFRLVLIRFADSRIFQRRLLVLGAGRVAAQLERLRRKSDWRDVNLLGYVRVPGEQDAVTGRPVYDLKSTLLELATELNVDEIVVAIAERRAKFPVSDILDCKMSGIQIVDLATFFERQTGKLSLDALNPSTLIFADGFIQAVVKGVVHRSFDVAVSLLVVFFTWPIMAVAALVIFLESGGRGPVLYRQVRVGRNGRLFEIIKFRSMSVDAEKDGMARWAKARDARVTRVGALIRNMRIDELPQLFNVLRGDMSFVGPRPERPEFVAELTRKIPYFDLRSRVNPGITGWAQICYPYGASDRDAKEKLQFDLYYIKNYSLFLDITIMLQTAQVILWGKGAR